jgi:hypothetical protein
MMSSYHYRGRKYTKKQTTWQTTKKIVHRVAEACKRYPNPTIQLPLQTGDVEADRLMREYPEKPKQPAEAPAREPVNADAKKDGVK